MSTPTHYSSSGFTLIETVVVMSIIVMLMGLGIPGIINAQRRADRYATVNIISSIHDACRSNAKQFGSGGAVYGFTILYDSTSIVSGKSASTRIRPWVYEASSTLPNPTDHIRYNASATFAATVDPKKRVRIQDMIGKEMMWETDDIPFIDTTAPAAYAKINSVIIPLSGTAQCLHVAYEPRTGFVHAFANDKARPDIAGTPLKAPDTTKFSPEEVSSPSGGTVGLSDVEIAIYRRTTTGTAIATNRCVILKTGVMDVRLP